MPQEGNPNLANLDMSVPDEGAASEPGAGGGDKAQGYIDFLKGAAPTMQLNVLHRLFREAHGPRGDEIRGILATHIQRIQSQRRGKPGESQQSQPSEGEQAEEPAPPSYMNLGQELRGTKNRIRSAPPPGGSMPLDGATEPAPSSAPRSGGGGAGSVKAPPIASQVPPPVPEAAGAVPGLMATGVGVAALAAGTIINQARSNPGSIGELMTGGRSERHHDSHGSMAMQGVLQALQKIGNIRSRM